MICFRLLDSDNPAEPLAQAVAKLCEGENSSVVYSVKPTSFRKVPNAPFAYWASNKLLDKFGNFPPFQSNGKVAKQGLSTADDFRFVRLNWEVQKSSSKSRFNKGWVNFLKGDSVSSFLAT